MKAIPEFNIAMLKNIDNIEITIKHEDINNVSSIRKFLIKHSDKDDWDSIYYIYTIEQKILRNGKVVSHEVIPEFKKANVPSFTLLVPFVPSGYGFRIDDEHLIKGLHLIKEGFDTNWKDFDWEVVDFKVNKKASMKGYYTPTPRRKSTSTKKHDLLPSKKNCPVKVDIRKML